MPQKKQNKKLQAKDAELNEDGKQKNKEKTQDMNHISKGLIPLYTVLNDYEVKRVFHTRHREVSESMALSKEQLTALADKKKESDNN